MVTERGTNINTNQEIEIIFEDNHLLVVRKPVNMLTQRDRTGDVDILTLLKEDLKKRYNKRGNVYLGLVHRLDRPVGGVMVFAKTSKAASRISEQIRTRQFKKDYLAVVHGVLDRVEGSLENYLIKDTKNNRVSTTKSSIPGAKLALLKYIVLGVYKDLSLIKIQLQTGRPHQIRVQLSEIGHPLYGDQKYGYSINKPGQQIALWSNKITMIHPVLKNEVSFKCTPPEKPPWVRFAAVLLQ